MKRGGFLRRHTRLKAVSDKVKAARREYDAVYRRVDQRSGGVCEVRFKSFSLPTYWRRCTERSTEHHHTKKPRRVWHGTQWVMAICRRHHDETTATFANGRLYTQPNGDETFTCFYRYSPDSPFKGHPFKWGEGNR